MFSGFRSTQQGTFQPDLFGSSVSPQDHLEDPTQRSTFGQPTSSQGLFGQSTFGQSPFGQSTFGQSTLGQSPFGPSTFGPSTFGQSPFGPSTFGPSTTHPSQSGFGQGPFHSGQQPVFGQTSTLTPSFSWGNPSPTQTGPELSLEEEPEDPHPAKRKWDDSIGAPVPPKRFRKDSPRKKSSRLDPRAPKMERTPKVTPPPRSTKERPSGFGGFGGFGQGTGGFGQPHSGGLEQLSSSTFGRLPQGGLSGPQFSMWREPSRMKEEIDEDPPLWQPSEVQLFSETTQPSGPDLDVEQLIRQLEGLKLESLEIAPVAFKPSEALASALEEAPPGSGPFNLGSSPSLTVEQTVAVILKSHGGHLEGRKLHLPSLDPMSLTAASSGDELAGAIQGQLGPVQVSLEVDPQGEAALFAQVNPRKKVATVKGITKPSRGKMEDAWITGNESEYQDKVGIRDESGNVIEGASPFETMRHVMEVYRAQQMKDVRTKKKLALGDTIKDKQGNIVLGNIQVSGAQSDGLGGFGETKVFQRPVHSGDWLGIFSSGEGEKGVTGDEMCLPRGFTQKGSEDQFSPQKYKKATKKTTPKQQQFSRFLGGKSAKVIGVNPKWEREELGGLSSVSVESKEKMTEKLSGTKIKVCDRVSDDPEDMYADRKTDYDASADAHSEAALWQMFQANDVEIGKWITNLPVDQLWHLVVNIESEREMCGGCSAKSNTMLSQLEKFAPEVHKALTAKNIKFKPETSVDAFLKFESGSPCSLNDHNQPHQHGFGKAIENKDKRQLLGSKQPTFDETFEEDPLTWRSTTRMGKPPTVESVDLSDSTVDPNVTPLTDKQKVHLFGSQQAKVKNGKLDGDWATL